MTDYLALAAGLALLIGGAELLVRGASRTAERLGMSPLLIGLTLVGFGTSTPELVASVQASLAGSPGIAVGNIVGSNIANILLILGLAALVTPIGVNKDALRRDGLLVLATAALFYGVGHLAALDRVVGAAFVAALAAYVYYAYRQERAGAPAGHTAAFEKLEAHDEIFDGHTVDLSPPPAAIPATPSSAWPAIALAVAGLGLVVVGGVLLVGGATGVARGFGVSEAVIGLTIVAVGTSLPELVTSLVAAVRGHSDVALGNVLGSNIYNILGIAGVTGLVAPTAIPHEIAHFDSLAMVAVSALLLVVARTGHVIGRTEGAAMIAAYVLYVALIWPH